MARGLCAALMFHLKQQAMRDCDSAAKAYAECASGRVFSVVWACRQEFGDLNSCLKTRHGSFALQLKQHKHLDCCHTACSWQ